MYFRILGGIIGIIVGIKIFLVIIIIVIIRAFGLVAFYRALVSIIRFIIFVDCALVYL